MSISFNPSDIDVIRPIIDSPLFTCMSRNLKTRKSVYSLNVEKLSKDQCHIFWTTSARRNQLIATMLEYNTFHPLSAMHSKFQVEYLMFNDSLVVKCSFPKEFLDICKKAAQTFDMHIAHKKARLTDISENLDDYDQKSFTLTIVKKTTKEMTQYCFPEADNVLWVKGKKMTKEELAYKESRICYWGDYFHTAGVD